VPTCAPPFSNIDWRVARKNVGHVLHHHLTAFRALFVVSSQPTLHARGVGWFVSDFGAILLVKRKDF
jgi:hypothetical protein